jgi:hypothetical protein
MALVGFCALEAMYTSGMGRGYPLYILWQSSLLGKELVDSNRACMQAMRWMSPNLSLEFGTRCLRCRTESRWTARVGSICAISSS